MKQIFASHVSLHFIDRCSFMFNNNIFHYLVQIDKVEDPKVLFERAQAYVKDKLAEGSDKKDK